MKIVINKGERIENAIETIRNFLCENYSDYPILKNSMNLYVTLENDSEQLCPDNEKEYIIENGHATNKVAESKELAYDETLHYWNSYIAILEREILILKRKIKTNKKYIETADEKGRKLENIFKKKAELEYNQNKLKVLEDTYSIAREMNYCVQTLLFEQLYIKHTYGPSYKMECIFVFNNINGYIGYFDKRGLHNGLPKEYK